MFYYKQFESVIEKGESFLDKITQPNLLSFPLMNLKGPRALKQKQSQLRQIHQISKEQFLCLKTFTASKKTQNNQNPNLPDFPDPAVVLGFVIKGFIVKGFAPEEVDGCSVIATSVMPLLLRVRTREEVSAAFPFI